jgi:hypothetical protein
MPLLVSTPKAVDANAYVNVARADALLGARLYATKWDQAAATPSGEGWLVNGSPSIGATSLPVDGGTGTWTVGSKFTLAGDVTVYTVGAALTAPGSMTISPGLVAAPADNAALSRITASQREASLIMATRLLDSAMEWKGWKTEETQALRWPRTGVTNPDGAQFDPDTYPFLLEHATVELALVLLTRDTTARPTALGLGVTEVKLGPMSAKIDSKAQEDAIPQSILSILSPLGSIESEASTGSRVVPLWRS